MMEENIREMLHFRFVMMMAHESSSCVEGSVSGRCVPLSVLACSSIITLMKMIMMMIMMTVKMITIIIVMSIITLVVFIHVYSTFSREFDITTIHWYHHLYFHDFNAFQELNAVYNLNLEKDIGQTHLLQAAQVMMMTVMVMVMVLLTSNSQNQGNSLNSTHTTYFSHPSQLYATFMSD